MPPTAARPQAYRPEPVTADEQALRRKVVDWLEAWRDCEAPACRRAHRCRGVAPIECLARRMDGCSEPAQLWIQAGMIALMVRRLSPRQATMLADAAFLRKLKRDNDLPLPQPRRRANG